MATVPRVVLRQQQIQNFMTRSNGPVVRDLERRAQRVLQRARELAPRDQGTLADSLQIVRTTQRGRPIVRITSNAPYASAVVRGTSGYSGPPDWRPGSALHLWGSQKGFNTPAKLFQLAKKIQRLGTVGESGNITGNTRFDGGPQDWLSEALKEAVK